ncbi:MAG: phosphate ABC transporter permease PstA [Actinobacteria bacterium]|nr:phosphate ABC transporter permease PstA [Actinomycetota bacterium]
MMAVSTPQREAEVAQDALHAPDDRGRRERGFEFGLLIATAVAVVVLAVLLIDIAIDGLPFINSTRFTEYSSRFPEEFGFRSGITGTLSLMILVGLLSFVIGVGGATYLEEFAPNNRFTRFVEANTSNLAGVPSVVYGLLGAGVFVFFFSLGRSLIVGAITLSLLILPVIIVASREALRAVPNALREAGLGLGATPLQTIGRQILPQALPGILTGTILALSRAIGETAPILVVGALFSRRSDNVPWDIDDAFSALPIQVFDLVKRPQAAFQEQVAPAGIIILLVLLLLMNSIAIYLRNRYSRSS